jgi:hypothetical protein
MMKTFKCKEGKERKWKKNKRVKKKRDEKKLLRIESQVF